MTVNDGWAQASLRLVSTSDLAIAVPTGLGALALSGRDPKVAVVPIADREALSLQQILPRIEEFVSSHLDELSAVRDAPGARLEVFLGWSPRAPQESVILGPTLLKSLAAIRATLVFDTYSD